MAANERVRHFAGSTGGCFMPRRRARRGCTKNPGVPHQGVQPHDPGVIVLVEQLPEPTVLTSVRRSLLFSFGEKYIGLAMQLGTVMILSRILTPAETGLFSVAAGLVSIAQAVRDFGVGTYILQERDLTRSRLGAALWISVL